MLSQIGGILIGSTFAIILMTLFFGGLICEEARGSEDDPFGLWTEEIKKEILVNLSEEKPLELDGRYQLAVESVDIDGNKVYSELYKDGKMIHSMINILANEVDDTFVYSRPGTAQEIRVHFKNSFRGADQNLATVDGLRQTSEINPGKIMIDDSQSRTIVSGTPLELEEGYQLWIQSVDIDGNKVYLELYKDGMMIDSRVIIPANEVDGTFIFSRPGTPQEIRVHFKNSFRGADQNLATIDGLWQTSEINPGQILINSTQPHTMVSGTPLILEEGWELAIKSIDIDGNKVYLELFKDGMWIDSQVIIPANEFNDTFIYSRPGTSQEIRARFKNAFRGADQDLATVDGLWQTSEANPGQILIDDSRSRTMTSGMPLRLEEGYELAIPSIDIDGNKIYLELEKEGEVVDSQVIMPAGEVDDTFIYSSPGTRQEIRVHFKNSFRGADQNLATVDGLWQSSETNPGKIMIDDSRSRTVTSGTPIALEEGYELAIQSLDIDGNKVYLELYKDGMVVDSQVIVPANEVDDTFIYSSP